MKKRAQIIPADSLESRILTIRGQKVIAPSLPEGHPLGHPFRDHASSVSIYAHLRFVSIPT